MSAIGEFRERVSLQQEARTPDTGGGAALSWEEVAQVWAAVEPLSGREDVQAEGVSGRAVYRLRFRCGVEVTPAMRVVWRGKILNIRSLRNVDARDRLMEVTAEEGVAV
ncbi:MAG TPA: phage head closure protein [Alphaproteobacteria bacterium]|nr:phage head closure protein [Alphaproteobacteria bacterium]